jgi:hypothetical protein
MSYKFVSIEYATTEEAAAVAAQLNATGRGGSVRVRTEGRILQVLSADASIADVYSILVKVGTRIVDLFRRSPDARQTTANGLRAS